jgi:uncharacterized protein (UPF0548 family)
MTYEEENARLKQRYDEARARAQEVETHWQQNPIVHSMSDHRVHWTTLEDLLKAAEMGTPDEAFQRATSALDEWRAFRHANGRP